jgi:HD-like signal output (HDOD) protein/ActR/RegA family two-component response regulator
MPIAAHALDVLIADADPWTAELLAQLVLDVRQDARVVQVSDGLAALAHCRQRLPTLVIADSELPGIDGLELLRQLRTQAHAAKLRFILISSRLDARSVRAAKPLAPTAYLAKPFNAEALRRRLSDTLPVGDREPLCPPRLLLAGSIEDYLDAMSEQGQQAPLLVDVRDAVGQCLNSEEPSLRTLEKTFSRDPQITSYLIAASNSAAQHTGPPCQTLQQALPRLGVARTLNLVLGLSIRHNAQLSDLRLTEWAQRTWRSAAHSAELAHWLAGKLSLDVELCYTAGLIHNIGELALLRCMQNWQSAGGSLNDELIAQLLRQRSASFGSALRIHWRLPFTLREIVTCYYNLGSGVFSREALTLNLVGQLLRLSPEQHPRTLQDSRCARLLQLDPQLLECIPAFSQTD